jgi:hypothetical protein
LNRAIVEVADPLKSVSHFTGQAATRHLELLLECGNRLFYIAKSILKVFYSNVNLRLKQIFASGDGLLASGWLYAAADYGNCQNFFR